MPAQPANSKSQLTSSTTLRSNLLFAVLMAASLLIWLTSLRATFDLALADERYTHILLVLPVSAALILVDWKWEQTSATNFSPVAASLLIAAVVSTAVLRVKNSYALDIQLALNVLLLQIFWVAAFALCFGERAFRRALFPLCLLLWLVPAPDFVLDRIVALLQFGSAASAHLLFLAARIPVAQRGMLIHIPGLTMEVAPECSSIRSSLMLLVTTMVLAHVLLRSVGKKLLVVGLAIPLCFIKNGFRIFILGVLTTRVDPAYMTGRLHREGGILYFLIALVAIFLLLWILLRRERRQMAIDHPA